MSKTVKFAAYGTLRKGSYNYERIKRIFGDDFNHVETLETKGIRMVCNNRAYPHGFEAPESDVIVDILECTPECFRQIELMEQGAGYQTKELNINGTALKTFLINPQYVSGGNAVGKDWLKYEKADYKQ